MRLNSKRASGQAAAPQRATSCPASRFSLFNTDGFWELTFNGQCAVVPQHQALFYIAFLLGSNFPEPICAHNLATQVSDLFCDHPDFIHGTPLVARNGNLAKGLMSKQKELEAILDNQYEPDPVKTEALGELVALLDFQKIYFDDIAVTAEATAERISNALRQLHAKLAAAADVRGKPQPVLRAFAQHLLHCVLIPSIRASGHSGISRFIYRPLPNVDWDICITCGYYR